MGIFSGKTFPWVPTILTLGVWPTFLKLTLVITFDQWVLELWYFTWMFPVARPFCVYSHFYPVTLTLELDPFLYPTQRVAEGIMFLTRPSVSQSVSPVFLASATPLKPLNRISWNFVDMKDIMCRCAYPQEILIPFFFQRYYSTQFVSATPLKQLNRISWNFVVMKDIMCRCAFLQEMLIWSFWGAIYIPFFIRLPVPNAWICHSLCILKQCWSVGYVSLLTLSFIPVILILSSVTVYR